MGMQNTLYQDANECRRALDTDVFRDMHGIRAIITHDPNPCNPDEHHKPGALLNRFE
jgi:hypothetical protein